MNTWSLIYLRGPRVTRRTRRTASRARRGCWRRRWCSASAAWPWSLGCAFRRSPLLYQTLHARFSSELPQTQCQHNALPNAQLAVGAGVTGVLACWLACHPAGHLSGHWGCRLAARRAPQAGRAASAGNLTPCTRAPLTRVGAAASIAAAGRAAWRRRRRRRGRRRGAPS
jgi:hypothetical protein